MTFRLDGDLGFQFDWQIGSGRKNQTRLMRGKASSQVVRRADVDVAVAQLKEVDVPQMRRSPCAALPRREIALRVASGASPLRGLPPKAALRPA